MNLALLIPDGVGVRNFVLGGFLAECARLAEVTVLDVIPDHLAISVYGATAALQSRHALVNGREPPAVQLMRYAHAYSHMQWAGTVAMRYNLRRCVTGSARRQALHFVAKSAGRLAAGPRGRRLAAAGHWFVVGRAPQTQAYKRLFERIRPTVLFCSHQRPPAVVAPVLAARALGIPTATFIFSWDNLTSKGSIVAPFDHYLVWSEHMRKELLRYYPEVPGARVHVVGTPQFDPYADGSLILARDAFFQGIGANPGRPMICYSGGDTDTSPDDPEYVRVLLDLIRQGHIAGRPQVLLRPAPVDSGERYDAVRRDYPELRYARPAWVHAAPGDWGRVLPTAADVLFLANLVRHANLNINMASTMTLDFAIHDRPVVNVAFDVTEPPRFGVPLWDYYYQFDHYRPVVELGAARFARSPSDLAKHVNAFLGDPSLDREARRQLVELEIGAPLGTSSRRIIDVLAHIARQTPASHQPQPA
jgi:hypothetical protein